jgi:hypothetical protein
MDTSTFHCDLCKIDLDITSKNKHLKSFKHILARTTLEVNQKNEFESNEKENVTFSAPPPLLNESNSKTSTIKKDDYFSLDDLRNDSFQPNEVVLPPVKEKKNKKVKPKVLIEDDNESVLTDNRDLFEDKDKPTLLFGKENLELLHKIKQYKILFPKELSKFRIKKKATTEELKAYIEEADVIISLTGVDTFVIDAILQTISVGEGFTKGSRYDISGLAMMLKMNPQFNSLAKQLYLKYGNFMSVPPESQMLLLVFTTTYICINKNNGKKQMNDYLNQPANV